jgi:hypothetical protein
MGTIKGAQCCAPKEGSKMNFTEAEKKEIEILIRLGDSRELAERTVVAERSRPDNRAAYAAAYYG